MHQRFLDIYRDRKETKVQISKKKWTTYMKVLFLTVHKAFKIYIIYIICLLGWAHFEFSWGAAMKCTYFYV